MDKILILSCNSDLGSCCNSRVMESIMAIINNIMTIIQIVVPILLLLMVCVNLGQLLMNPDDKKKVSSIKNKFIAAVVVFFVPLFVSVAMNIVSDNSSSNFNLAACMKESKNIKVNSKVTYQDIGSKPKQIIVHDTTDYEKGQPSSSGNAGRCVVAEKVRKVNDFSHGKGAILGKANGVEVANYAKTWVGTMSYTQSTPREAPFKVGGTCDCSHFVYQVLKHFGLMDHWVKSTVWGACGVSGTTLYANKSKLVPGDVLAWGFGGGSGHVEIYVGNGQAVGCNGGRGVVLHSPSSYHVAVHLSAAYD